MRTREKINALRRLMADHGLDAYLVPSTDAHQSEYVPECWRRRAWLSGFTGSAGDLLVGADRADLWTDGRYFLQAERQLRGSGIRLQKLGEPGVLTLRDFLERWPRCGQVIGVDPQVLSAAEAHRLETAMRPAGLTLRCLEENLVDRLWTDRPGIPRNPVEVHPVGFAGESVRGKLSRVRKKLAEKRVGALVVTTLDAVAWLFNLRGSDVAFNPVCIAYGLLTRKEASLFVHPEKVTRALERGLGVQVRIHPYEEFGPTLRRLSASAEEDRPRVWVDEASASRWVVDLLGGCELTKEHSPILVMKSKKNETEIAGMRAAHVRDGVAMCRFLHWLEREVPGGGVTEMSAARTVEALRAEGKDARGLSFETISGYGPNGAIVHYAATPQTDLPLRPEGIYLIDSGGQYRDGTTDITRTVLLGKSATREQRERFTRVLQGHIALATLRFPAGVRGMRLESFARRPLWEAGLDYNHGTGHGVGAYLSVHEGPQSLGARDPGAPLEPGNILSNEPGFYQADGYGIRIENLLLVVEDAEFSRQGRRWLRFETLTLCPIDRRLIDGRLLAPAERRWLDAYHRRVYQTLAPHLEAADRRWLRQACATLR